MNRLTYYPALRLVFPFITGILLAGILGNSMHAVPVQVVLTAVFTVFAFWTAFSHRCSGYISGFALLLSFFLSAVSLALLHGKSLVVDWPDEVMTYCALTDDWPDERNNSIRFKLTLGGTSDTYQGKKVFLYVPKDTSLVHVPPGTNVRFEGLMETPSDFDDNDGFDYGRYLFRNGISGTVWAGNGQWELGVISDNPGLKRRAAELRGRLLELYADWGLDGNALAVVSAVTLADKSKLDEGLKDAFSASGTSHLLAVSGLHVGIMYSCLAFLIPLAGPRMLRSFREIMILSLLWTYAVVIGLPLSIVRSLVMFTFLCFARCSERDSSSLNSLALAALVILVADPNGVYDTGFQLSFAAVLSILLIQPGIADAYEPENAVLKYMWSIITVSTAAQIGTAPLVAYKFFSLPTYFIVTNIVAIPVMFVIVALSMLLWTVSWIPFLRNLTIAILTFLVDVLDSILEKISSLPGARIRLNIDSPADLAGVYLIIVLAGLYIKTKRTCYLIWTLLLCIVWLVLSLYHV